MIEPGAPDPYPTGLLDLLKPRMSPKLVRYIAESDDGLHNYPKQRDAIISILRSDRISLPLEWEPREALSLVKWSEPNQEPMGSDKLAFRELHTARLFCCACLLAAYPQDMCHESEPSDLLPRLIESVIAVEGSWLVELHAFVAWAKGHCDRADPLWHEHETDATLCRMALVIIAAAGSRPDQAEFVSAVDEIFARKRESFSRGDERWTWLLEGSYFDQSAHIWKSLADRYLLKPPADWSESARSAAVRLGESIIRDDKKAP